MPIYMDLHIVPGVNAKDVAAAHRMDVLWEKDHSCKCLTYWIDEIRGQVFCLIDAPDKESVEALHRKSHGLIPHKIIEVEPQIVASFLGRISDPIDASITETGLLLIEDSPYRVLMSISLPDPFILHYRLGGDKANDQINRQTAILKKELAAHYGIKPLQYYAANTIGSFTSAEKAINCAYAIYSALANHFPVEQYRIFLHAGQPVDQAPQLFGKALQTVVNFSLFEQKIPLYVTDTVKQLLPQQESKKDLFFLSPGDEQFLATVFDILEKEFDNPAFSSPQFAKGLALSVSQLYRKISTLTGLSPNALVKKFRLQKALSLLKQKQQNITQVAYRTGFTSPSYFTKCFKNHYGLLPAAYLQLLC